MEPKIKINIYTALPDILVKVKGVALTATIGKTSAWMSQKLKRMVVKGAAKEFVQADVDTLNLALARLSEELATKRIVYTDNRDEVIEQVKEVAKIVSMPYIYMDVLKKNKFWYTNRIAATRKMNSSFSEDDILQINLAVLGIANHLKIVELTL